MTEPRINGTAAEKIEWLAANTLSLPNDDGTMDVWLPEVLSPRIVLSPDGSWWIEE